MTVYIHFKKGLKALRREGVKLESDADVLKEPPLGGRG
jgi:hypothetical protein